MKQTEEKIDCVIEKLKEEFEGIVLECPSSYMLKILYQPKKDEECDHEAMMVKINGILVNYFGPLESDLFNNDYIENIDYDFCLNFHMWISFKRGINAKICTCEHCIYAKKDPGLSLLCCLKPPKLDRDGDTHRPKVYHYETCQQFTDLAGNRPLLREPHYL